MVIPIKIIPSGISVSKWLAATRHTHIHTHINLLIYIYITTSTHTHTYIYIAHREPQAAPFALQAATAGPIFIPAAGAASAGTSAGTQGTAQSGRRELIGGSIYNN